MTIADLQRELASFAAERDWQQFHTPKNLVMALTGEAGELTELFQWLTSEESAAIMADQERAARVREEMADVFSYLLRLADVLGVDLESAMTEKIAINAVKYPVEQARSVATKYTDLPGQAPESRPDGDGVITLRPVREEDLGMLEALTTDPEVAGEFAWFGWHDPLRWRRAWTENRLLGPDGGALVVASGSEPAGFVVWSSRKTTVAAYYWEIGIAMLRAARGHGHGTRAQAMLASYLFAHTTAHRIEASTETGNLAEQRALEKAGFTREGVRRGAGWRDGAWRDGVTYSLLRTDQVDPA